MTPTQAGGVAATSLLTAMGDLWPHASVRQLPRGHRADAAGLAEYALAPSASRPSLAVDPGSGRGAANAVRRFHAGLDRRQVLVRSVAAWVSRMAPGLVLPDRVEVVGSAEGSLAGYLAELLGEPVRLVLGIGSERVNRKPVVAVQDVRGRPLAFAKVGSSPVAAVDVRAEAEALRRLGGVTVPGIVVPRLLDLGDWQGHPVLVATALTTHARQRSRWRDEAPELAMGHLQRAFAEPAARPRDLPWFAARVAELEALADPELREEAATCVGLLAERASVVGEVGAWHGDWTPWNMSVCRGRRGRRSGGEGSGGDRSGDVFHVWDWERFETGVPGGLDAVHYRVNVATQRLGATLPVLLTALGPRPECGEADPAALYLLAITSRYLRLSEGPGGERIAARGRLFLSAWRMRG